MAPSLYCPGIGLHGLLVQNISIFLPFLSEFLLLDHWFIQLSHIRSLNHSWHYYKFESLSCVIDWLSQSFKLSLYVYFLRKMIEWPYLGYILSVCFNEHIAYKVSTGTSKELPNFLFQIPMSLIYFITFTMEKVIKCSTNHPVLSMWVLNSSFKLLSILLQWLSKYLRPASNQLAFAGFFPLPNNFLKYLHVMVLYCFSVYAY